MWMFNCLINILPHSAPPRLQNTILFSARYILAILHIITIWKMKLRHCKNSSLNFCMIMTECVLVHRPVDLYDEQHGRHQAEQEHCIQTSSGTR